MKSYAELEVFDADERRLLQCAEKYVGLVPHELDDVAVRCHELARAVGVLLNLEVADGHFGFVEHSWLWTKPPNPKLWYPPNILDVYVPGSMPQVQLVHMGCTGLPPRYDLRPIKDLCVRDEVVGRLLEIIANNWRMHAP